MLLVIIVFELFLIFMLVDMILDAVLE